eukprot:Skav204450  [mRNA]  locus=scaffold1298:250701:254168:+ [translate_table: standard]
MRWLRMVLQRCTSLVEVGAAMLWTMLCLPRLGATGQANSELEIVMEGIGKKLSAVHRGAKHKSGSLFPLPLGEVSFLKEEAMRVSFEDFIAAKREVTAAQDVWTALSILALNGAAGFNRAASTAGGNAAQQRAVRSLRACVTRTLSRDFNLQRTPASAEKELSSRHLTYSGEVVPSMQVIGLAQIEAALPPASHGGSIDALKFVSPGTQRFLTFPDESLLDTIPLDTKLQSRVHITKGEELAVCKLLVERQICSWIPRDDVLEVRNTKILNGLFAVGKGTFQESGKEVQRLIMNLVPTNGIFRQLQGSTRDLPSISQYLGLVLDGSEQVQFFQSDMSAAFYLFKIPSAWGKAMAFNIGFDGKLLGLAEGVMFQLCCNVVPMGWGSSVAIMQEIADRLTVVGRLPRSHQVRRTSPLPMWMVEVLEASGSSSSSWFHVYLDNFCSMGKVSPGGHSAGGESLHTALEKSWEDSGVLSSAKKRISGAEQVVELGASLEGEVGTIGISQERLVKLVQTTLVVINKRRLRKKWVQIVAGRWVHALTFRRAGMVFLEEVWRFIAADKTSLWLEQKVKAELWGCCLGALLLHSNLRAPLSKVTTCSDASTTGGAVGLAKELTKEGQEFTRMDLHPSASPRSIPVLVLSLFNGIGCAFRCYDLCGVLPQVGIAYELSKAANRVTSRRWPWVQLEGDVRELDEVKIREWRYLYPEVEEVHCWAGFPCVDLSSVRARRLNLEGPASGLFWEIVRILKSIRRVYGYRFPVKYICENVASMDVEAEREISQALGTKPFRVDCADAVPIHRPRFCWHNLEVVPMEGASLEDKLRWVELSLQHPYPAVEQWLEPGASWDGHLHNTIFPTCMKSIPRTRPPEKPAGLERVSADGRLRWEADSFRFPPYQYGDRFIIWINNRWRLLSATERELLHGLGYEHTALCWSASDIKRNPLEYDDVRKSLVGDSFSCFSFVYFAAMAVRKWINIPSYHMLWNRMGLAPGFSSALHFQARLQRRLVYTDEEVSASVSDLHKCLVRRTNHTGSDVRIATSTFMNPKAFPRQSVSASWWHWQKVFSYRWGRADHINSLELRSIVHSIEYRIKHLQESHLRIFHLSDSYIAISIIAKGRTSSRMLRPLLRRLAASLLAFDLYLVLGHVESSENPTDDASRA